MIQISDDLSALRARIAAWKRDGLRIGLVPTMGNLHAGHYALIALARTRCDRVVASSFVNPTQFGRDEDFARYPRTPEADAAGLDAAGCDLLWRPSVETMYPFGPDNAVRMRVPGITDVLDGAHRPGHFDGVATVVTRLFHQVQPDVAVFGRKDYQQLAVIDYLVRDLAFPIALLPAPIVREADGLAMSSRNQYLSAAARAAAPAIYRTLLAMQAAAEHGATHAAVEHDARAMLETSGFELDYAVVRAPDLRDQMPAAGIEGDAVALIAARIGGTRLIDNLEFSGSPAPR
ncbi:MAG: pantoate--beta-alanine ligase [Luteimonas sp.]